VYLIQEPHSLERVINAFCSFIGLFAPAVVVFILVFPQSYQMRPSFHLFDRLNTLLFATYLHTLVAGFYLLSAFFLIASITTDGIKPSQLIKLFSQPYPFHDPIYHPNDFVTVSVINLVLTSVFVGWIYMSHRKELRLPYYKK
jgi:hypothetical protein